MLLKKRSTAVSASTRSHRIRLSLCTISTVVERATQQIETPFALIVSKLAIRDTTLNSYDMTVSFVTVGRAPCILLVNFRENRPKIQTPSMIQLHPWSRIRWWSTKNSRLVDAMSSVTLNQHFKHFLLPISIVSTFLDCKTFFSANFRYRKGIISLSHAFFRESKLPGVLRVS